MRCLPRRGTGTITALCRNELGIFQALADYALQGLYEAALVIVLAFVEPKRLLIAVSEQMKRLNVNVSAFERTFQKRPKVFQSVSVNLAACVEFQMVNDLAVVIFFKIV